MLANQDLLDTCLAIELENTRLICSQSLRVKYIYEVCTYKYIYMRNQRRLHALKLNVLLNIKTANCAKVKKLSSQEGIQRGKMCTTDLQPFRPIPIFDQFLFPTNSYFRPISISDQFLFLTNSYFRPIPISDQFLFQTNAYFRPCKL